MYDVVMSAWQNLRVQLRTAELAEWWGTYDVVSERRDRLAYWARERYGVDLWAE